ncbi:MAG TPA: BatA domain-containing protein [Pirellulaceae bacterium]|nr:BatA domain-containing protein [Pirellulaceae bacterium]HMO93926.1 BatA domain-containing protein [Pirellulaceae bacterium]HMP69763.1 BatA domain-containing protein [Pirellulaceae bacterium]
MSFLAWTFGLGALAIAFPFLFHLIRRRPRQKQVFSSLLFLRESPPRITRKSRLENLLLLLMRSLAVVLLSIAFMRPFFPESQLQLAATGQQVVILLDTSASMQRPGLWKQAVAKVEDLLGQLNEADDVALMTFDKKVVVQVDLARQLTSVTSAEKRRLIRENLQEISPSWFSTNLGGALVTVAELLQDRFTNRSGNEDATQVDSGENVNTTTRDVAVEELLIGGQIHLISDLQEGADISSLNSYKWPDNVFVQVHQVQPEVSGNAYLTLLQDLTGKRDARETRVRVFNTADALTNRFTVQWEDARDILKSEGGITFVVPPGTNQTLSVPRRNSEATLLRLQGDAATFDNEFYTRPLVKHVYTVGYLGDDAADDADGLQFYLRRALTDTATREVRFIDDANELILLTNQSTSPIDWLVIARSVSASELEVLRQHVAQTRPALIVLDSIAMGDSLTPLVGPMEIREVVSSQRRDFRLFGQLDFQHPIFKPLSGPQYNDFTKIRFWRYREVLNLDSRHKILARFDNGAPAIWEAESLVGRVHLMASGWNPNDSQLALSTKFVPLIEGLFQHGFERPSMEGLWLVGDTVTLPPTSSAAQRTITAPSGQVFHLDQDQLQFSNTDQPGIYTMQMGETNLVFAVNLDEMESRTTPMDVEQLSAYQVRLGSHPTQQEIAERLRAAGELQIENRQKIWKWALIVALVLLILETFMAGVRASNQKLVMEPT